MLNEIQLNKIFKESFPPVKILDIHWKAQDSDKGSILFYKIMPDQKSRDLFTSRIDKSQFAWLIVNEDHPSRPMNSSVVSEVDWPGIQKELLDLLYPLPCLKMFAVTGTNGKTTTADLILQLGELSGKKGLSIGTLGVREYNKTILDFGLTSPSLIDLRKFLFLYGRDKDFCVLEASSHALIQKRYYGIQFDMGGWLSFSQDHLDYHKTMEEYFSAKLLIFDC
jgi:UDP-N-acetylmuramoyl-L-alanyl-D-glutamate--2,6-diaminopimelate ligase